MSDSIGGRFVYMALILLIITMSPLSVCAVGSPNYLPDGPHPRIILNSDELSRLVGKRDAQNADYSDLITWCDGHIADEGYNVQPTTLYSPTMIKYGLANWDGNKSYNGYRMSGFSTHIYNYALAYQVLKQPGAGQNLTKAAAYAARVRTLLVDGIASSLNVGEEANGLRAIRVSDVADTSLNASEITALQATTEALPCSGNDFRYH